MALFRRRSAEPEIVAEVAPPPVLEGVPESDASGRRTLVDHRNFLLSQVKPLPPFGMDLVDAWGLAVCEDIVSDVQLPRFTNSQLDGYAVIAADLATCSADKPVLLDVVATVHAGESAEVFIGSGQAAKIMTGAPLPAGADAVVGVESTNAGQRYVEVHTSVSKGDAVRAAGVDLEVGRTLVKRGQVLDARHIGLLAAAGIDRVLARPRPRVVIVTTGVELAEPGRKLPSESHIHDANGHMLSAAAKAAGAVVYRVPLHTDDPERVREVISDQLIRADIVITTGGVSMGEADVVKQVLPELGITDFSQVAMQPGKPQGFGLIGEDKVPVVSLPGNPVSSYVSFQAFVLPMLRRLMGIDPEVPLETAAIAEHSIFSTPGVLQLARGVVRDEGGRLLASVPGGHGSHLMVGLAEANALVLLPPDADVVAAGSPVSVWMLDHD